MRLSVLVVGLALAILVVPPAAAAGTCTDLGSPVSHGQACKTGTNVHYEGCVVAAPAPATVTACDEGSLEPGRCTDPQTPCGRGAPRACVATGLVAPLCVSGVRNGCVGEPLLAVPVCAAESPPACVYPDTPVARGEVCGTAHDVCVGQTNAELCVTNGTESWSYRVALSTPPVPSGASISNEYACMRFTHAGAWAEGSGAPRGEAGLYWGDVCVHFVCDGGSGPLGNLYQGPRGTHVAVGLADTDGDGEGDTPYTRTLTQDDAGEDPCPVEDEP